MQPIILNTFRVSASNVITPVVNLEDQYSQKNATKFGILCVRSDSIWQTH
jgi:hypothetical protein